jgi:hypothetical protein
MGTKYESRQTEVFLKGEKTVVMHNIGTAPVSYVSIHLCCPMFPLIPQHFALMDPKEIIYTDTHHEILYLSILC